MIPVVRDERPWGHFIKFPNNSKLIVVKCREALSLQLHHQRDEYWYVLQGIAHVTLDTQERIMQPGDTIWIPRGCKHRLAATDTEVHIIEIPYGHFDELDIVRFDDRYGRT